MTARLLDRPSPAAPAVGRAAAGAPTSTYRFQFNKDFPFDRARQLVDYLDRLGLGGFYCSPISAARPGSLHGYDVIDHGRVNAELGGEDAFIAMARAVKERNLSLVLDTVPNHMCIADPGNALWNDVLMNGPASPNAKTFDILWTPPKPDLRNKVLLPFLGDQYGRVLENQELSVAFEGGGFHVSYYDSRFPLGPRSWALVLSPVLERINLQAGEKDGDAMELESIITALVNMPDQTTADSESVKTRTRETEIARKRLSTLAEKSEPFRRALQAALADLNGRKGDPRSFDALERLLTQQSYRLGFWRVAADEINYRRFFDISDLAAIRVEEPQVFEEVHRLAVRLISERWVSGLRIDHVDGLHDPKGYLDAVQRLCAEALGPDEKRPFFVVVEKILTGEERLRTDWATSGTTGYDFAGLVNGLFVETENRNAFAELYARVTGRPQRFADVVATCKKLIMLVALASELRVLSIFLDRISEQHRYSRDFTQESLRFALREVIAYFPVYRSYIRAYDGVVSPDDRAVVQAAIAEAKRHNPATDPSIFDFIQDVLFLRDPAGLSDDAITFRRNFVMRFQQLTSPVMAKGVEDTAFYRYFPLASLNEVGGDPERFGTTIRKFHAKNAERAAAWPAALIATTTHDTKRSEDVRARMNVLSEIPAKWYRAVRRWQLWNRPQKSDVGGQPAPDGNDEYLLYQTLFATWPLHVMDEVALADYRRRIVDYMGKAVKEAKTHTSWINPNDAYEKAMRNFIERLLSTGGRSRFLEDMQGFCAAFRRPGLLNAVSQVTLKLGSPGVPDFYQGTELWDFSLVDPDNRRPVDFAERRRLLGEIEGIDVDGSATFADRIMNDLTDGRIKMFVTHRGLQFRRRERDLFLSGKYVPVGAEGYRRNNVVSFARVLGEKSTIVAACRFYTQLGLGSRRWIRRDAWGGTLLVLRSDIPPGTYRNVFTGELLKPRKRDGKWSMAVSDVMNRLPVAILERLP